MPPVKLVLDWDGTVTETDTLWMALDRFGDPGVFASVEGALVEGRLSFRAVMELEFSTVRAPLEDVRDYLLAEARLRPGLAELVRAEAPLVVSSGFHELIEPLLERDGLSLEVRANRLEARPEGWRVRWRDPEPCSVCGDLCKRSALPEGPLVFVGDGYSDRCAALAAGRVFARDGLAEWLAERGVPFERYADLSDVAAALAGSGATDGGALVPRTRSTGRK